jgi:hypothetical protein
MVCILPSFDGEDLSASLLPTRLESAATTGIFEDAARPIRTARFTRLRDNGPENTIDQR